MPKIVAICLSKEKVEKKKSVERGTLKENYGLVGDAHAGTPRQVSLLAMENIDRARNNGMEVNPGESAENIVTEGVNLISLPIGTKLHIGKDIVLEVTQIGKKPHRPEFTLLPKKGIFAKVLKSGEIRIGDKLEVHKDSDE